MADVFISYRSLRQPSVRHLKRVLEAHGYSVWFDYGLLSGEEFAPVIERELREARAAIVIWCRHSQGSHWVREEADLALALGNYLPVLLDPIEPPFGFRRLDTIDLSAWDGDPRGPGLDRLLEQISKKTGRDPAPQYKTLVELQLVWRDTGRIAWAALPLDEKLAAQIEEKRKAAKAQAQEAEAQAPQGALAQAQEAEAQAPQGALAQAPRAVPAMDATRNAAGTAPIPSFVLPEWVVPAGAAVLALVMLLIWSPWKPEQRVVYEPEPAAVEPAPAAEAPVAAPAPAPGSVVTEPVTAPAKITPRLLHVLKGHGGYVWSAAFSPDGSQIVTGSSDHTARIWDAKTGALRATLKGHGGWVFSAAFSPDGARIVTASSDDTTRIWNAQDSTLLATLRGHKSNVNSASFSPDGARIVTASDDKTARIWNASDGTLLATLSGHERFVNSAGFSPEGGRIVTASDATTRIWNASDGALLATLTRYSPFVFSAGFSPDGARIVTASNDDDARIWNASDGTLLATLSGHGNYVSSAAFSPDGSQIVTGSRDNTARLWALE